ncbi:hypothetical protein GCM10009785_11120 [Brooklawnia cerclae]|uniref:O-antigen/teichoic acid export membrane protein n=1 Tax=Brooklawnia cerclae TaxID=349934 RepID=A0ABX0SJZ5_9ACTN|nr:hypothetical protein [Brooklawnia cerclae]NIH58659.1 O-antigen/teichoic acid export membrane protein [Brooklawnia cerclae]
MDARLAALKRLSAFVLTSGMSSLVSLIAVPVIIARAGDYQWGIQAAIQSAATLFGVVVAFGWGTTGTGEVAILPVAERPQFYAGSLVSRIYLWLLTYPLMALVMALLNPDFVLLVLVGSATYLMPFLGASWYFVGESKPSRLFWFDALPQTTGLAASVVTMLITSDLVATVTTQLIFNTIGVSVSALVVFRTSAAPVRLNWSIPAAFRRLWGQRHSVATSAASSLYVSTPLLVLNALHPSAMSLYAMGDKLFRFGLTAFTPVLQFIQGWLPEGGRENLAYRVKRAAQFVPFISLVGAACILALGPWASRLLSANQIDFGFGMSLPFALVFFAVSITQVLGLACLVQLKRTKALATSTIIGATAGIPLVILSAWFFAAQGVAWALVVSEIAVLVYQAVAVARELRQRTVER